MTQQKPFKTSVARRRYRRKWYRRNRASVIAKESARYHGNRSEILRLRRQRYPANRRRILAQCKASRLRRLEAVRAYDRNRAQFPHRKANGHRWYMSNRELCLLRASESWRRNRAAHLARVKLRRARLRGATVADCTARILFIKSRRRKCFHCKRTLPKDKITIDHLVPLTRGGKHAPGNLVPSCKSCNSSKGNKLVSEWKPN